MTIRQKLSSGFGAIIFIIGAFGLYIFNGINTFDKISDEKAMRYEQLVDLEIVENINTSITLAAMDLIVKKDEGVVYEEYTNDINELIKRIYDFEEELTQDADTKEEKALVKELMSDFRLLESVLKQELPKLITSKASDVEFAKMDEEIDSTVSEMAEDIDKLKKSIQSELKEASENEATYAQNIKTFVIIVIVLVLLISIAISFYLTKSISHSLDKFQNGLLNFFKYLNRENLNVELLDSSSKDEIAKMAKVVNENIEKTKKGIEEDRKFIDDTVIILSEFEQGDLAQRITNNVDNPALMDLKKVFNSMGEHLENNINEILDILEKYTNYNYLNQVQTSNVKHHLLNLSNGVNNLGSSIVTMLTEEKRIGLTLNSSSDTLLQNVNVLNDVSNEAAASLEETAAALEEMTGTIISNTQNVIDMADFAHKVTASVDEGNKLANQTTSSMDEINEKVSSINEAITVIDQIAFQTNILSLNAAVEAATAGEAGKGFAVVAQEVRNLAARSAEAAKEIKDLVEDANEKANSGKTIADKMIHGYTDLNENIKKTIELINQVEAASKEQQSGIEQINDAVTVQDQQTQKIASAANETQEIAIHTSHISKSIVEKVDEKEFAGKNDIVDKREKDFDLNYPKTNRREAEEVIKKHKNSIKRNLSKPSNKVSEPIVAKEQKTITPTNSNDDEWESF